jgi:hypothetical protein
MIKPLPGKSLVRRCDCGCCDDPITSKIALGLVIRTGVFDRPQLITRQRRPRDVAKYIE